MRIEEMTEKSNFIKRQYLALAKCINHDIVDMDYVFDSRKYEELLVITYKNDYKKTVCITCDSLRAIVFDSIIKL